jgi:hypothetical protein
MLALVATAIRWPNRPTARQLIYCAAWAAGILVFAGLIRFGLWEVRYHLPGFVLSAPIVATRWPDRWSRGNAAAVPMLVLALASIPVLVFNQSHELVPLWRTQFPSLGRDRPSYLTQTPLERLFANQLWMIEPYRDAIDVIAESDAAQIGLILDKDSCEYPIWSMLRWRSGMRPARIEHVLVSGEADWPLGAFAPEMLFWDKGEGEAPETLTLYGKEFHRIEQSGPIVAHPNRIAVFARGAPR